MLNQKTTDVFNLNSCLKKRVSLEKLAVLVFII